MMSTRWINFEKGRQETSTKLNVLRIRRLRTDGENTSTSYSTTRVRKTAIELDDSIDTNRRFVWRIQESEMKEAFKKMKTGKTLEPDDIPIEVWRCLEDIAIV
jgi:hypothetical protein